MAYKRLKRSFIVVAALILAIFATVMFDTFFRQVVFGPNYGGIPVVTWQRSFRQGYFAGPPKGELSTLESIRQAVISPPDRAKWEHLSGEDRRAVLLTLAGDSDEFVRFHIADDLGTVPATDEIVKLLKDYSRDPSSRVRQYAARSIGRINPPAVDAVPDLLRMLNETDPSVNLVVRLAIQELGAKRGDVVVPQLIPLILAGNNFARLAAIEACSSRTQGIQTATPALVQCLRDGNSRIRARAARVLGYIGAADAVPQITEVLDDADREVRTSALFALRDIGPAARTAVPKLIEQVKALRFDREYHHVAPPELQALGQIGPAAKDAIPAILELRNHESHNVRAAVEDALTKIDPEHYPPR